MFTHLHLHTKYSVLDGVIRIPELAQRLKNLDMKACAITDHGTMFGVFEFYQTLQNEYIKPIIGCEVYTTSGSRYEKAKDIFHLVLLAQNKEGYENLSKLLTKAYLEGFYKKPRIDDELLEKHNKGIIALSACLQGEISKNIFRDNYQEAVKRAKWYKDVFDGRYYLELQDNGIEDQYRVNDGLIKVSKELEIPIVATNDCHYINKKDAFVQDVLICVSTKAKLKDENRLKIETEELYLKSKEEMSSGYFKKYPEAIENTNKIVEQCDFHFKTNVHYLPVIGNSEEESAKVLESKAWEGLKKINKDTDDIYKERLLFELNIIQKMGYSSYYLIVSDFISWARSVAIPVGPGRGSGAASLVAYSIGITSLDPIKYDLIFERFLNPERISLPDFDIDFCSRRRDEIFDYITKKYGERYTAKIATFGLLKARGAIKDVGRVLGYEHKFVDSLSKMVPMTAKNITEAIETEKEFRETVEKDPDKKKIVKLAGSIEGAVRNIGSHAGGVIISSKPIDELSPLILTKDSVVTTQFDMTDLESVGLIKFDLLAIDNLTIISDAVNLIRKNKNKDFNIEDINLDDENVYKLLARGDTIGIFQLESLGMQRLLRELIPERFEDIIAVNALYRPGPLNGGMVEQYVNRKHGREEIDYQFKELESILKETHGIIVYQEQVQRIASVLAGYSLGEADILRRAMGKKKQKEMDAQKKNFIAGAKKKNFDEKKAEEIFDLMAKFAEYGFNKAHAAVYALNAYRTAYLKYYYTVEFLSALLTSKAGKGTDELIAYIIDSFVHSIIVLPPDINESVSEFIPKNEKIRFGFLGIKDMGSAAIENILDEREKNGPFTGFVDFCTRIDTRKITKKVIEQLVKSGAFDSFGINRGILFANIDNAMSFANERRKEILLGQSNLFIDSDSKVNSDNEILDLKLKTWDRTEILNIERETLGVYLSGHPMDEYENILKFFARSTDSVKNSPPKEEIVTAGILTLLREIELKDGNLMGIFNLEDRLGNVELVAFKKVYKDIPRELYTEGNKVVICIGQIEEGKNANQIIINSIQDIEKADLSLIIKANIDKIKRDNLEKIFLPYSKNKGDIKVDLEITSPYQGTVILNLGNINFDSCVKMTSNIKNNEVSYKWSLNY